jgi:large subunit ribosomal protein L21
MHAVIKTGGKQYRVAANDVIEIEKLSGKVGDWVQFADVLMVDGQIGKPTVKGASVAAEIENQGRGDKVVIFKKRRRHNYRRKKGHRQDLTTVRITEILTDGMAPSKAAIPALWNRELGRTPTPRPIVPNGLHAQSRRTGPFKAKASASAAHHDRPFELLKAPEGGKADELGLISGVADKTEHVLNDHGIYHFWQIANMTDAEAEKVEHDIKFHGRIRREEWREQARELMAGKAPRAKIDKAHAHDHDDALKVETP